jgi:hypothetical protein
MVTDLKSHRGTIIFTLSVWIIFSVFWIIVNWEEGLSFFILFGAISLLVISSQVFWIARVGALGKRFVANSRWRKILGTLGLLAYVFLLAFSIFGNADKGSHLTLRAAVLEVPFSIWFVGSVLGFVLVLV